MRDLVIAIVAGVIALLVWSGWQAWEKARVPMGGGVACTMEAKQCPDGSYVGRTGPKCEFAACPTPPTSFKDAVYTIEGMPAKLGEAGVTYFGNDAEGDLDGDGLSDIAFLLTHDSGGSGTFYYVAVALSKDGGYIGTNAIFLGDRIAPQTTEIQNGIVVVNYADRMPTEPMTARPSLGVSKHFVIEDGLLVAAHPF